MPPSGLDGDGNHIARIRQLLPLVRDAADDLAARLAPNDNAFSELARDLGLYRVAISASQQEIAWSVVWGRGVRLETTASAVERKIDVRLAPTLEDATHAALQSPCTLHGPGSLPPPRGVSCRSRRTGCV